MEFLPLSPAPGLSGVVIHEVGRLPRNARWADAIKDSGVKYVLSMAKHHDGFCMFDTSTTDYKITSPKCPFHADPRAKPPCGIAWASKLLPRKPSQTRNGSGT